MLISRPFLLIAATAFGLCHATASAACQYRDAATAAVGAEDFIQAAALYETIEVDPACDDAFRGWLAEALARDSFAQAMAAPDIGQQQRLYERSLTYAPHWRSYDALSHLAAVQGDRASEAQYLQQAINQLTDGPQSHSASETEVAMLLQRASDAMLLSDTVVEIPPTRSGAPGGIFSPDVRGFTVEEVTLAITFEFGTATMTPKGRTYAAKLLDHLQQTRPATVVLEGHTDPKGDAAFNDQLSAKRIDAVVAYLREKGYSGSIQMRPMGERAVPPAPDGIAADSPDHHQIARRVVLVRG